MNARLSLILLGGALLAAQGPDLGVQVGWGSTRLRALTLTTVSGSLSVDPSTQQGLALRGLATWKAWPGWEWEGSVGWRPRSSGALDYRSSSAGQGRLDVKEELQSQLLAGLLLSRGFASSTGTWSLGLGLDGRWEKLAAATGAGSSAASLRRLWYRAVARHAWGGKGQPFVALEFAAPLSRPSTSAAAYLQDLDRLDLPPNPSAGSVAKAHAPASELVVAAGFRFSP